MRSIDRKIILYIIMILLLILPTLAGAIGQMTQPVNLQNALRGKSYSEKMTIMNTENFDAIIKLSSEGDIADWTRFYKEENDKEDIKEIKVPARSKIEIIAEFSIPADAPNGSYLGNISVMKDGGEEKLSAEDSGSSVSQKIDREVNIQVNDKEEIVFDASFIPEKYDLNKGDYLKIRVVYDNRGNVEISPQVKFKIKQEENTVYAAIYPYPENEASVNPFSIYEIPQLEIPTSNLQTGKYKAFFTVSQGDKYSFEKEFSFSIGAVKSAAAPSSPAGIWTIKKATSGIAAILFIFILLKIRRGLAARKRNRAKIKTGL